MTSLAEIACSSSDRNNLISDYERQIRNIKQQAYREGRKARDSLAAWFEKTGSVLDLIDFEKHASKQQAILKELVPLENLRNESMKRIMGK
jgi:hypothetical protein